MNFNKENIYKISVVGDPSGDVKDPAAESVENIDINKLDFDFDNLKDNPESTIEDIQSINPLHAFSQRVEIDLDHLHKEGFITPDYSDSILSKTYRVIKRPILNNVTGKGASPVNNANLIMVTSSLPGEGKTFSAINLAISIAMEQDKRVLLVDADINKPSHFKIFGIDKTPGLTDILLGECDNLSNALCRTNIPSLSLMSSGRLADYPTELLASAAMSELMQEISTRYKDRIVIFDSPPLLLTTEASVLAQNMGQVILVVEAEFTQNIDVKRSLDILSNEIVLLLLNKQREKVSNVGYGYGYGYGQRTGREG